MWSVHLLTVPLAARSKFGHLRMQPTGIRKKMHDISLTVWWTPSIEHAFVLAVCS